MTILAKIYLAIILSPFWIVGLHLLLCRVFCWYFKIDKIVESLEEKKKLLR
jgi:hypothetical protein